MQTHLHILKFIQSRKVTKFVARAGVAALFGLLITGATVESNAEGTSVTPATRVTHTPGISSCLNKGEHTYTSTRGFTSVRAASRSGLSVAQSGFQDITSHVHSSHKSSSTCIPDGSTTSLPSPKRALNTAQSLMSFTRAHAVMAASRANSFPYGVCTWYADQRYHELHGTYVPWSGNANQWPQGANAYGWRVSSTPRVGSIIALQSGVQGAGGLGHVGVVEQVKGNNTVIASSMNWGANPGAVTRWQFHTGAGVTFISQ